MILDRTGNHKIYFSEKFASPVLGRADDLQSSRLFLHSETAIKLMV